VLLVVFAPIVAAGLLVGGVFLWSFGWKVHTFFAVHFALVIGSLMAIPILRLTTAENALRIAVPAIIIVSALAVAVRIKASPAKSLIWLLLIFFTLGLIATSLVDDPNEWSFFAIEVAVAFAAVVFASAAAKIRAWHIVAKVLILATVAEAAIGIYEVFRLSAPIWRGGRILPDGSSTWIRNEVVASMPRAQGTFGHPLPFAFSLIIGAILVLRTKLWLGVVRFGIFVLLAGGVFVSGSRNALILFVLLTLLTFLIPSLLTRLPLIGSAALAGLVLAFPFLLEKFQELVGSGSVEHRLGALTAIDGLVNDRDTIASLIGDGSAAAPRLFSQGLLQTDGFAAVDNQFVLTLAQNGILGLILLMAVMAGAFRKAPATLRVLLLAVTITAMIFDLFTWPVIGFLVWFMIASAFAQMPGTAPPVREAKTAPVPRQFAYSAAGRL
jgi:hypothetical protein